MSAGFPLLRLPLSPLKNVFDIMRLDELTILSLCSAKTRNVLTAANKKFSFDFLSLTQRIKLNTLETITLLRPKIGNEQLIQENSVNTEVTVSDLVTMDISGRAGTSHYNSFFLSVRIECINQKNNYKGTNGFLKIADITVPVVMLTKHIMITFWENESEGIHYLINFFKTVFHSQNIDFYIRGERNQKFSQNIKTAVKGMAQNTIDKLFVNNGYDYENKIEYNDYKFILDNFKPTTSFVVTGHRIENFQHETNFNSQKLVLNPAKWFTIGNLLSTNCENITLYKTNFTNDDMKEYLKQWMAGRFPKLKHLTVELSEYVRLEDILRGLSDFLQGDSNEINGFEIVRDEGDMIFKQHGKPTARISTSGFFFTRKFVLYIM